MGVWSKNWWGDRKVVKPKNCAQQGKKPALYKIMQF